MANVKGGIIERVRMRPKETSTRKCRERRRPQKRECEYHNGVYDTEFVVEAILDRKSIGGSPYYKVKWAYFPESQCTWEPLEHLTNVQDMVKDFETQQRSFSGIPTPSRPAPLAQPAISGSTTAIINAHPASTLMSTSTSTATCSSHKLSGGVAPAVHEAQIKAEKAQNPEAVIEPEKKRKLYKPPRTRISSSLDEAALPESDSLHKTEGAARAEECLNSLETPNAESKRMLSENKTPRKGARDNGHCVNRGEIEKDLPRKIERSLRVKDTILCTVSWKPRKDGSVPAPTIYSTDALKELYPLLLLDYYEATLIIQEVPKR